MDEDGNPIGFADADQVSRGAEAVLYFNYTIDVADLVKNQPYTFSVGGALTSFADSFSTFYGSTKVADGAVAADGMGTLIFNEAVEAAGLLAAGDTGSFCFSALFDSGEIGNAGKQDFSFSLDGVEQKQDVNFAIDPVAASAAPSKSNAVDLANKTINWEIQVTPAISNATANLANPGDATGKSDCKFDSWTISDVIPEGLTYAAASIGNTPAVHGMACDYEATSRTLSCMFPADMPIDGATTYTTRFDTAFTDDDFAARAGRRRSGVRQHRDQRVLLPAVRQGRGPGLTSLR